MARENPSHILKRHGLKAKHSWGQNFLGDPDVLAQIARSANLSKDDTVVELGAGLGHLTQALLDTGASVVAVERDRDMVKILKEDFAKEPRLRVLEANATELEFAKAAGVPKVAVLGNLPYHLTSSILFAVLEQRESISRAVFTLQKEVVTRLAAQPGNRDYGILTVLLNLYFDVELLFTLPAAMFHPPPQVDSATLSLWTLPEPRAKVVSDARFIRLVKAAFAQRRKTLSNSLKSDPTLGDVSGALAKAGIDGGRRAETLAAEEFAAIERALVEA
jgi:16S rRNA (adenine1518-N6/adenine1519-N6)-dimethyltransferase